MLTSTGIADNNLIQRCLPSPTRRASGPYPMIECFQEIPCNPCSTSCPFHAILPMDSIHDIPVLDFEKCTGCGACARVCPGLAIFIIDESRGDGTGSVTLPYEFSPLPQKGEIVSTMNRAGCVIGEGTVLRVSAGKTSGTPLVTLSVPIEQVHDVRFFCSKERADRSALIDESETKGDDAVKKDESLVPKIGDDAQKIIDKNSNNDDEAMICRCEGITRREIRELIAEGYTTVDEIKRISRAGMGPCQARTCGPLIADEIARMTGQPRDSVTPSVHRPPIVAQPIAFFTGGDDE